MTITQSQFSSRLSSTFNCFIAVLLFNLEHIWTFRCDQIIPEKRPLQSRQTSIESCECITGVVVTETEVLVYLQHWMKYTRWFQHRNLVRVQLVTVVSEEQPKEVLDDSKYEVSSMFSYLVTKEHNFSFGLMILSHMLLCIWNSLHESMNAYLMGLWYAEPETRVARFQSRKYK